MYSRKKKTTNTNSGIQISRNTAAFLDTCLDLQSPLLASVVTEFPFVSDSIRLRVVSSSLERLLT